MKLGANCHYDEKNSPVMAAAITDLDGNIVFSSHETSSGNSWVISGVKTYETQFWTAGNATVALTAPADGINSLTPDFPDYPRQEDQFCVYLGWIDRPREISQDDLQNDRLLRNFIGVVDNIQFTGSGEGGATIKIEARDRMKWLMDSEVYYSPGENIITQDGVARSALILDISNRAVGVYDGPDGSCGGCGITIEKNDKYIVDIGISSSQEIPASDLWYREGEPLQGSVSNDGLEVNKNPEFRIFTSRDVKEADQNAAQFILNQQYPIEMIRMLSFQEVYPTDLFSYRDGNIYYCPRNMDSTAFATDQSSTPDGDPSRFYRTYYYKRFPTDESLDVNQKAINFREEKSTSGMKTNYLVRNSSTSEGAALQFMYHIKAMPYIMEGKDFACKFKMVKDPTIETQGAAAMVGLAAARRLAREARAGMLTVIGDPSIRPGEAVQVFGSPFVPNGGLDQKASDLAKYFQYKAGRGEDTGVESGGWDQMIKRYSEISRSDDFGKSTQGRSQETDSTSQEVDLPEGDRVMDFVPHESNDAKGYLCDSISKIKGKEGVSDSYSNEESSMNTFAQEPQTIFRVEAVVHKFNLGESGFSSELALISPF